jgi:hypothetical protein
MMVFVLDKTMVWCYNGGVVIVIMTMVVNSVNHYIRRKGTRDKGQAGLIIKKIENNLFWSTHQSQE